MKQLSIKHRLLKCLLVPIMLSFVVIGLASYYSALHEGDEIYDAEMARLAVALHTLSMGDLDEERTMIVRNQLDHIEYQKYISFRVWKNNKLLLQSDNAQDFGPVTQTAGFTKRIINDKVWLFYVYPLHNVTVEVAEENEVRLDLIRHIMAGIFLPMLAIFPLTAFFLWVGLNKGLAPINNLSEAVRRSDVHQLEPLKINVVPKELANVVDEINNLIRRVVDAIRVEKNFTNYAAHEMRTPIAALKTQVQVILRTQNPEKQKELTQELLITVSRTQRLVEQLLAFARVQNTKISKSTLVISDILLDLAREYAPLALNKNIKLDHEISPGLTVTAHEELLRTLFSNLLDNATKYTPENGHIILSARSDNGKVSITISDDGAGIPEKAKESVFDPFFRLDTAEGSGAGLGLAIVKWATELLNADIEISEGLRNKGTSFTVTFEQTNL